MFRESTAMAQAAHSSVRAAVVYLLLENLVRSKSGKTKFRITLEQIIKPG